MLNESYIRTITKKTNRSKKKNWIQANGMPRNELKKREEKTEPEKI